MRSIRRFVLPLLLTGILAIPAWAEQVGSTVVPAAKEVAGKSAFKIAPPAGGGTFASAASITLPPPGKHELDVLKAANASRADGERTKALQIGFPRAIPVDASARITPATQGWAAVPGGQALQVAVGSPTARSLRLALKINPEFSGELRFAGSASPDEVMGPYTASDWAGQAPYWSPVADGERAVVEVFIPQGAPRLDWLFEITGVSHLAVQPTQTNQFADIYPGETGSCEVNIACSSNQDYLNLAKAVARMVFTVSGSSYVCTGTLLNDSTTSLTPYFYTANHCISNQTVASTLNTYWFFEDSTCQSRNTYPTGYTKLTKGATYLDSEASNDHSFLRLNDPTPGGAWLSGWDGNSLSSYQDIVGIHHPNGDVKKISLGYVNNPAQATPTIDDVTHYNVWKVKWTSGVTEGGSSGSGLFTCDGTGCYLRGGLIGGGSSCSAKTSPDYYSDFGVAYERIKGYLYPASTPTTCTYSLSPASQSAGAGGLSGTISVTVSSGCAWTAVSNASWITITAGSSGSGSGAVYFSVAANTGTSSRTGTITVGVQSFTVTQDGTPDPTAPVGAGSKAIAGSYTLTGKSSGTRKNATISVDVEAGQSFSSVPVYVWLEALGYTFCNEGMAGWNLRASGSACSVKEYVSATKGTFNATANVSVISGLDLSDPIFTGVKVFTNAGSGNSGGLVFTIQ